MAKVSSLFGCSLRSYRNAFINMCAALQFIQVFLSLSDYHYYIHIVWELVVKWFLKNLFRSLSNHKRTFLKYGAFKIGMAAIESQFSCKYLTDFCPILF